MVIIITGDGRVDFDEFMRIRERIAELAEEREKYLAQYKEQAEAIGLTVEELEHMAMLTGRSIDTYLECMEALFKPTPQLFPLADFVEVIDEEDEGLSAAEIKKQLKYEKNPMRVKQLNKMLYGMSKKVRVRKPK